MVSTTNEAIPTAGAYIYSLLGCTSIRRSESLDATATVKGLWKIESTSDRSRKPSSKWTWQGMTPSLNATNLRISTVHVAPASRSAALCSTNESPLSKWTTSVSLSSSSNSHGAASHAYCETVESQTHHETCLQQLLIEARSLVGLRKCCSSLVYIAQFNSLSKDNATLSPKIRCPMHAPLPTKQIKD